VKYYYSKYLKNILPLLFIYLYYKERRKHLSNE
jgi:hypothetical protein